MDIGRLWRGFFTALLGMHGVLSSRPGKVLAPSTVLVVGCPRYDRVRPARAERLASMSVRLATRKLESRGPNA